VVFTSSAENTINAQKSPNKKETDIVRRGVCRGCAERAW
jgi:hypothetical protein